MSTDQTSSTRQAVAAGASIGTAVLPAVVGVLALSQGPAAVGAIVVAGA